jgi:hypothetical protein
VLLVVINKERFMNEDSKIAKDLERLKRQIGACEKKLEESLKKAEKLGAAIGAEMRTRQHARNKRKNK